MSKVEYSVTELYPWAKSCLLLKAKEREAFGAQETPVKSQL